MKNVRFFYLFLALEGLKFPSPPTSGQWTATPSLQPFLESRATSSSILLAWSLGRHSLYGIDRYEVRVRWPLTMEIYDFKFYPLATSAGMFPSLDRAKSWSSYFPVYSGLGRQFSFESAQISGVQVNNQRIFEFSVRAVTDDDAFSSPWSAPVLMHTVFQDATLERFYVDLVGTGRNNAGYSSIFVKGESVFHRTDLKGFALAVFDRSDFSLKFFDQYDVSSTESESLRMANDLATHAGPEQYIAVVSGDSWEWKATPLLSKTLEGYGAYYLGQWAHVFSNQVQPSPYADLSETQSQDSFGHPYAFFGCAGWGPGNGYESLQLNTGQYLAREKSETAKIRIPLYYNYMLGRYFIAPFAQGIYTHEFFSKSQLPKPGSLHNPVPFRKTAPIQISLQSKYAPYMGNLWNAIDYIREANETVILDEFNTTNSGFQIVQQMTYLPNPLVTEDPRPSNIFETELERIWGGPCARYSQVTGELLSNSVSVSTTRICPSIFTDQVCLEYDDGVTGVPLLEFAVGLWPTVCSSQDTGCISQTTLSSFSVIAPSRPSNDVTVSIKTWALS